MAEAGALNKGGVQVLTLSRKAGEEIIIGDDICLVVVRIGKGQVQLGIEAPKNVTIHRREIYEAIQREVAPRKALDIEPERETL